MKVLALGSAKASPGVTTAALALAVTWPDPVPVTIIEADPAGGDLAAWLDLPAQPGLVSLAAAGRRALDPDLFAAHLQAVPGSERVAVLCGPVAADQAHAALSTLRERLVEAARQRPGVVLVDCGRLDPSSPALRAFEDADVRVLACRPSVAAVHHLQARARTLPVRDASLLAVGDSPYLPDELASATGLALLGALPLDARAAATLGDGPALSAKALARSSLVRAARALAEALAPTVPADHATPPDAEPGPPGPASEGGGSSDVGGEAGRASPAAPAADVPTSTVEQPAPGATEIPPPPAAPSPATIPPPPGAPGSPGPTPEGGGSAGVGGEAGRTSPAAPAADAPTSTVGQPAPGATEIPPPPGAPEEVER